jgi:protein subunit release factor B
MNKELLFSITSKDCEWKYTRGTGNGGQKKNKTNSAVHCIHRPSTAHGYAEDHRSQLQNKKLAFERMANSKEFQTWIKLESQRRTGELSAMEDQVDRQMRRIKVEIKEDGLWKEINKDDPLLDNPLN